MNMQPPLGIQKDAHTTGGMELRTRIALGVFLAIAAFFLLTKHWEHVWPLLPYLFLLACPLMHLFHHGHGGHAMSKATPPGSAQTNGVGSQEEHH